MRTALFKSLELPLISLYSAMKTGNRCNDLLKHQHTYMEIQHIRHIVTMLIGLNVSIW